VEPRAKVGALVCCDNSGHQGKSGSEETVGLHFRIELQDEESRCCRYMSRSVMIVVVG